MPAAAAVAAVAVAAVVVAAVAVAAAPPWAASSTPHVSHNETDTDAAPAVATHIHSGKREFIGSRFFLFCHDLVIIVIATK